MADMHTVAMGRFIVESFDEFLNAWESSEKVIADDNFSSWKYVLEEFSIRLFSYRFINHVVAFESDCRW